MLSRKLFFMGLLGVCVLQSCDDESPKITEQPFKSIVQDLDLDLALYSAADAESYSIGYEFEVTTSGKATAVGIATPEAGSFTVQIYEVAEDGLSGIEIAEGTVTVTNTEISASPYAFKYVQLNDAVNLKTGTQYRVAYNTNDGQDFYRLEDLQGNTLPITTSSGKVKIIQGVYGDPESFPDVTWDICYPADIEFEY